MQPEKKDITIEELRQISGYENFSDQELIKISDGIKELALLLNLVPSVDQFLKK
ncbi:hypothetical protein BH11BAC1_BH11BAC1_16520 [soil metagenome]